MSVSERLNIGEEGPWLNVDSAGNATAVWQRYRGGKLTYESAVRQADGPWSTPSRFFAGPEDAGGLQIAVDPQGNVTVAWVRHVGHSWVVQSATRPVGGSWSAPVTLSRPGAFSPLVAVDPEGEVTAVWLLNREEGWRSVVESATRSADGTWSEPVALSPPRKAARSPQIALDPQGGATVVWEEEYSGAIESATRSPEGTWSAPVTLTADGVRANWPHVVVDPQGDATAIWSGSSSNDRRIQTATRPAGGTWSAPVSISAAGHRIVQDPQIAVDPQGEATAIWQRSDGSNLVVQGANRRADGSWSAPVGITTGHDQGGQHLQLVVDARGEATAVWEGFDSGPHTSFAIQGAKRPPGGVWSRPTDISRRTRSLGAPQIAIDSQGRSTAIWTIGVKGGAVIQSATSVSRRGAVIAQAAPSSTPRASAFTATVAYAVDGDTLRIEEADGDRAYVRLIGIDSPESVKEGTPPECGAEAASRSMDELAPEGAKVRLVFDGEREDDFGRTLAHAYVGGRPLELAQLRRGWAEIYRYRGRTFAGIARYYALEDQAKAAGRGVWGQCGGDFHSGRH